MKNLCRHLQIFNQNEFFRGISLPVPPTLETLESKMPSRILQNPYAIDFLKVNFRLELITRSIFNCFPIHSQKCLDKDPNKRWSCDRLIQHPYFEDYIVKSNKEPEVTTTHLPDSSRLREKSKISQTSLPTLVQAESRVQAKNTYSRGDFNHLPTI